jgi:hypothetical protein
MITRSRRQDAPRDTTRPGKCWRSFGQAIAVLVFACRSSTEQAVAPAPGVEAPAPMESAARSRRQYMLSHYADTEDMRRSLITGRLGDYRQAAAAVARDEWKPASSNDSRAFLDGVRGAASAAEAAPTLAAGAVALGSLGEVCASCHLKSGHPEAPLAPEDSSPGPDSRMFAHAVAADRLWAGLILPSDANWMSGVQLLAAASSSSEDAAGRASLQRLRTLGQQGEAARVDERGRIFADVLIACSNCHERAAVSIPVR